MAFASGTITNAWLKNVHLFAYAALMILMNKLKIRKITYDKLLTTYNISFNYSKKYYKNPSKFHYIFQAKQCYSIYNSISH